MRRTALLWKIALKWVRTWPVLTREILQRGGIARDRAWAHSVARWLLVAFAAHLIAVVSSVGFYEPSEQFQVAEFVSLKLGKTAPAAMAPEFREQTVSWVLPATFRSIVGIARSLGAETPFQWALGFRLLSAFIGWMSLALLALASFGWLEAKAHRTMLLVVSALCWFIPALHARHSPENIGGALFFAAMALLWLTSPAQPRTPKEWLKLKGPANGWAVVIGAVLGLAFEVRFSTGFMTLGLLLWSLIIARMPIRKIGLMTAGFFGVVTLSIPIDYWGYEQWTLPWLNAAQLELTRVHDLSFWGLTTVLREVLTRTWPFLGVIAFASVVITWIVWPKHPITWALVPYLLAIHIFGERGWENLLVVGHVLPLTLVLAATRALPKRFSPQKRTVFEALERRVPAKRWVQITQGLFAWNLIALFVTTVAPAWMPTQFYSKLYRFRAFALNIHYGPEQDPFSTLGIPVSFYRPDNVLATPLQSYGDLVQKMKDTHSPAWLFHKKGILPEEAGPLAQWCQAQISTFPQIPFRETIKRFASRVSDWTLYRCENPADRQIASEEMEKFPHAAPVDEDEDKPEGAVSEESKPLLVSPISRYSL